MGIFSFLNKAAAAGRENTQLILIFQENANFASLSLNIFKRCLADRGLTMNTVIFEHARIIAQIDPKITMGEFIERDLGVR